MCVTERSCSPLEITNPDPRADERVGRILESLQCDERAHIGGTRQRERVAPYVAPKPGQDPPQRFEDALPAFAGRGFWPERARASSLVFQPLRQTEQLDDRRM